MPLLSIVHYLILEGCMCAVNYLLLTAQVEASGVRERDLVKKNADANAKRKIEQETCSK